MGARLTRSNLGRLAKHATVEMNKKMAELCEEKQDIILKDLSEKLLTTYKENVMLSYSSNNYEHTNTFINSIGVRTGDAKAEIVIDKNKTYADGKTVGQVYEWLVDGTTGTRGKFYRFKTSNGYKMAESHDTPRHLFEEHTLIQMKAYFEMLKEKINNGKYNG